MLLSRIFSLLLGTTLFVMIWTMQDGDHGVPRLHIATDLRPMVRQAEELQEVAAALPGVQSEITSVTSPVASEQALWMFADEQPAQIAVK